MDEVSQISSLKGDENSPVAVTDVESQYFAKRGTAEKSRPLTVTEINDVKKNEENKLQVQMKADTETFRGSF